MKVFWNFYDKGRILALWRPKIRPEAEGTAVVKAPMDRQCLGESINRAGRPVRSLLLNLTYRGCCRGVWLPLTGVGH